jgi:hypothetical protein
VDGGGAIMGSGGGSGAIIASAFCDTVMQGCRCCLVRDSCL